MNKLLFSLLLYIMIFDSQGQSKDYIDSLNNKIQKNLNSYDVCLYTNLIEEGVIDSIWFYSDNLENLLFIHSLRYQGSLHNAEDFSFENVLIDSGKAIYLRSWGYFIENPNKIDPNKSIVIASESTRSYYNYTGESILCHDMREVEGLYKLKDSLLNSIPLKPKSGWLDCMDRSDKMIENNYIKIFESHCLKNE